MTAEWGLNNGSVANWRVCSGDGTARLRNDAATPKIVRMDCRWAGSFFPTREPVLSGLTHRKRITAWMAGPRPLPDADHCFFLLSTVRQERNDFMPV